MTAKEYLKQLYILDMRYKSKMEEVIDLRELVTSVGAIRYDKEQVQTSKRNDQLVNAVIKITTAENEAMRRSVELADKRQEIIDRIINLDDGNYIRILCMHYVHYKKFEDISDAMHYSCDWIRHLHGEALKAFESKYPEILKE
ncbi:MAG: hypothetical protein KBT03_09200 [Bacteroidales bacterium]|nr:hypothetical protein [Candidatus Scybalousia scybalohippi]